MVIFVVYSLTAEVSSSVNNVTRGHTVNIGRQCWMVRGLHGRNLNTHTPESVMQLLVGCMFFFCVVCTLRGRLWCLMINAPPRRRYGCLWFVILMTDTCIGVNAAGLQGSLPPANICADDPQYFDKCFYFFPPAELLNTASRCHFHLQCSRLVARSTKCKALALAHTKEMKNS